MELCVDPTTFDLEVWFPDGFVGTAEFTGSSCDDWSYHFTSFMVLALPANELSLADWSVLFPIL